MSPVAFLLYSSITISDGTETGDVFAKISKQETDEGTQIVQEFFNAWKALDNKGSRMTDEDPTEAEQKILQQVVEQFKDELEGNAWVKTVLENF